MAKIVFESRSTVIQLTRQPNSKVNLRDTISSTQIYSILKKNGVFVDLGHIKVLLRELGLPYNGPSTSFTMLFNACKAYLHGQQPNVQVNGNLRSDITQSEFSGLQRARAHESKQSMGQKSLAKLKDLFYATKENLYELFKVGMTGNGLDYEGFYRVVQSAAGGSVSAEEIDSAFKLLQKDRNGKVSFRHFEETFRSEQPTTQEFETVIIRKVREWMFQSKLSSEMAYDSLCRAAGRFIDKTLSRS